MSVQASRSTSAKIRETAVRYSGATKTHQTETPKEAWLIVALLFLFMLINFADKAVIGIAAVPIMEELQLSPRQFGLLGSSFYLLFSVSAIVTGFIVNRVETRWALLVMGLVWALTQFPMLGSVGFATIIAARIALAPAKGRLIPWHCTRPTNGFRTSCAPCPPPSSRRAPASPSWWRCHCST